MKPFHGVFSIVETRNCPLYEAGERLELSEKTMLCPEGKEVCLILVRDMTQLLFQFMGGEEEVDKNFTFNCSGCRGLIKFTRVSAENGIADSSLEGAVTSLDSAGRKNYTRIIGSPFLKTLPVDQVDDILSHFREITLEDGAILIRKGEENHNFYLVFEGELAVEDNGIFLETLVDGDLCGEMSYLGADIAVSTVRAAKKTQLLAIAGDTFADLLGTNALVQAFVAQILAKRLRKTNADRARDFELCMSGRLDEIVPAELFQIFNMHKKTGVLAMELRGGTGKVSFREGCLINATYAGEKNQGAIFKILAENKGVYRFTTGLSPEEMKAAEIGDFMMLLMEGVKRVDEEPGN